MFEYKCKLVRVIDGDTVDIDIDLGFGVWLRKQRIRMYGIDTPEIRTKCEVEKEFGLKVRDTLREKILRKVVTVQCHELDKYGRLLIDVFCDGSNVNNWLIDEKYAFKYDDPFKLYCTNILLLDSVLVKLTSVPGISVP